MIRICPSCRTSNRIPAERLNQKAHCGHCRAPIVPLEAPAEIGSEDEYRELITKTPLPVLIDFWAPWCGPCRMVAPEISALAKEKAGRLVVAKVNTEELKGLAAGQRINAIPTLVLFRGGVEVDRESGAMRRPAIVQRFGL